MPHQIRTWLNLYYRALKIALTFMMFLLLVPVSLQVAARYTALVPTFFWTEEVSRFAFIWVILLGSTIAIRDNTHFVVDVLPTFGRKTENLLQGVTLIAMTLAGIVFVVGGWKFLQFGWFQRSELGGLPMAAIFIAWPFLGVSWLIFVGEKIWDFWIPEKGE